MSYIETKTFIEVFPTETDFINNFTKSVYSKYLTDETFLAITYDILLANYKNSKIAAIDTDSFKRKINFILFSKGPACLKKLEIQEKVLALTEDDIRTGTVGKFTHGYNPSDVPGTANSDTEIETVNEQSLNKYTKSKLDGYNGLLELIKTDIMTTFINNFRKLFMTVIDINSVLSRYIDGGSY